MLRTYGAECYYRKIYLIVKFESQENIFPIEVLNEIRAIYGHVVRVALADNEQDVSRNIVNNEGVFQKGAS